LTQGRTLKHLYTCGTVINEVKNGNA